MFKLAIEVCFENHFGLIHAIFLLLGSTKSGYFFLGHPVHLQFPVPFIRLWHAICVALFKNFHSMFKNSHSMFKNFHSMFNFVHLCLHQPGWMESEGPKSIGIPKFEKSIMCCHP